MKPLNRRDFLGKTSKGLIRLSSGLYISAVAFSMPGCGPTNKDSGFDRPLDETVFDNFPIDEITQQSDLYVQNKKVTQSVLVDDWRLTVGGAVNNRLSISYQELAGYEQVSVYSNLICVSNPVGGDKAGNCKWSGVRLKTILEAAGVLPGALDVALFARDDYSDSFPLSKALSEEVILATKINDEVLNEDHGYPVRAIVPNIYGMKNVKWIDRVEVLTYDYIGYYQQRGWSDTAKIKTHSIIRWPDDVNVSQPLLLAGVAYGGDRGVAKVEISFDDGATWDDTLLKPSPHKYAWRLWAYKFTPPSFGDYSATIRAVETNGATQGDDGLTNSGYPDGANAFHKIGFTIK